MVDFEELSPYQQRLAPPDWSQAAPAVGADEQRDLNPENAASAQPRGSAAQFPYDPQLRVEMQVGLDKLRCVPDRDLAQLLYNLHVALKPRWGGPDEKRWLEQEARRREDSELAGLIAMSDRVFKGEFGDPAKQLAELVLLADGAYGRRERRTDLPSLREFDVEFRKLRKLRVVR